MRFDFSEVGDVDSYCFVPPGWHRVKVAEVREGLSREGATRWGLRLEVLNGECAGRTAAWDSMVWSESGVHRIRNLLEALGFDVSGVVDVLPADLVGREADVQILHEEQMDDLTGRRVLRSRVAYLGWRSVSNGPAPEVDDRMALDMISVVLAGRERSVETLDEVAAIVRGSGRQIAERAKAVRP